MSTLESIIWHVLGYGVMPVIFLGGFIGVFFVSLLILKLTGAKSLPNK
ncbi:TIGR02808 family protein [Motilimonas sp. 1_MG-2023]|nr:TIGR02808 family protein [Motilimonas sp. 1_MG-2023]MDO6525498.1 TIGR02808 family protein [Motilimonas sp. 1_MG-2023]